MSEVDTILQCVETWFSGLLCTGSVLGSQVGSLGSAKAGPPSCPWHLLLALQGVDEPGALLRLGSEGSPVGPDLRPAVRDGEAAPPHGPDAPVRLAPGLAHRLVCCSCPCCAVGRARCELVWGAGSPKLGRPLLLGLVGSPQGRGVWKPGAVSAESSCPSFHRGSFGPLPTSEVLERFCFR